MKTIANTTPSIRHDLFAQIQFEQSQWKNTPSVGKRLGRPWVFRWIFNTAWLHFSTAIANADWSLKQSSKSLFANAAEWSDFRFGERQALGRCLRFFVAHGMLPLRLLNPHSTGTKYYGLVEA